jgi:hypothetical protein
MDDTRMRGLAFEVKATADAISRELGYAPEVAARGNPPRGKGRNPIAAE